MGNRFFISYSRVDARDLARTLANRLIGTEPSIPVWLDELELQPGMDWDQQIEDALRTCAGLLFLMTGDSVHAKSECRHEWTRALRYKKPIIPLLFDPDAEMPLRLEPRQYLDFTGDYKQPLARLREHMRWRSSPEGVLQGLKERLLDAERDLRRAKDAERARIEEEMEDLRAEIAAQEQAIADPEGTARKAKERIESALARERQPAEPVAPRHVTKFINPPPVTAPSWFQDRHVETEQVGNFLKDPGLRMMTVVGRGGVGKTAMVCRLLKALEAGHLPNDLGPLSIDGIVYLSPKGLRQVTLSHLYADLCKLLAPPRAELLDGVYRNPQAPARAKMQALLEAFPSGRTLVLLDNFEDVVDGETGKLHDQELEEALRALLELPAHGVKVIITTRVAPRALLLREPGRQRSLALDEGLPSPFAEKILRAQDPEGKLGLRDAPDALLATARERTQGYPRALEALAAILATDRSTTLEEVLADTKRLLPEQVVEALVGEAFSRLDPLAQQVMQALAALAAPVPEAAVDYVLQPHVPGIDSAPVLRRLVNMRFARRDAGRFHLHQVDRGYAMDRIPAGTPADRDASPTPFTRFALLHRAAEYYQSIRTPPASWKTVDDLAPQLAEFEVRLAGQEYDAAASVLLEIDFDYLLLWGHAQFALNLHERLKGHLTDRELMSSHLGNMGVCCSRLGDYRRAIDHQEQHLAIAREIGDRRREGAALVNLGVYCSRLGDYRRAIDHQEQSLAIAREIGDRRGEGLALGSLGNCYYSLGDYRHSIDHHEQHLAIAREIGHRTGEGAALSSLGNRYYSLGDYRRAIDHQEQSLAIAREIGHRQGEGITLCNLGHCYYSLGDYRRAVDHIEQSLAIAREIGDRYLESNGLVYLGLVYRDTGQSPLACKHFQDAIDIAEVTGDRENQHGARFAVALAQLYTGELAAARKSIDGARRYDFPANTMAAWTATGIIQLRQSELVAAREAFARGLTEADELLAFSGENVSALDHKGLALCGLALCEDGRHLPLAEEAFAAARKITRAEGVVASVLNLFDALARADKDGRLAQVRKAAEGG